MPVFYFYARFPRKKVKHHAINFKPANDNKKRGARSPCPGEKKRLVTEEAA
jgi:hypothetical protein